MVRSGSDPLVLTLSSSRFPEEQRLQAFSDAFSEHVLPCRLETMGGTPFWADMTSTRFGTIGVTELSGSPMYCRLEPAGAEKNAPGIFVAVMLSGRKIVHQAGREAMATRGEAAIVHSRMPFVALAPDSSHCHLVSLPDGLLRHAIGDTTRLAGLAIDGSIPEMRLLPAYLGALQGFAGIGDPGVRLAVARHLSELLLTALTRRLRNDDPEKDRGPRSVRLAEVKRLVGDQLAQPTLNAARIARQMGVSERYVQKLVEDAGTTFSVMVMERRLAKAYRDLAEDRDRTVSVSDIAYAAGFTDASHFARAFRRRYGMTPSAVRGTERAPRPE